MRNLLGWTCATVAGAVGWWVGAKVGLMTAVVGSAVATGVGLYLGWRLADRMLG